MNIFLSKVSTLQSILLPFDLCRPRRPHYLPPAPLFRLRIWTELLNPKLLEEWWFYRPQRDLVLGDFRFSQRCGNRFEYSRMSPCGLVKKTVSVWRISLRPCSGRINNTSEYSEDEGNSLVRIFIYILQNHKESSLSLNALFNVPWNYISSNCDRNRQTYTVKTKTLKFGHISGIYITIFLFPCTHSFPAFQLTPF